VRVREGGDEGEGDLFVLYYDCFFYTQAFVFYLEFLFSLS
jgi:hypothetical protein